MQNYFSIQLLWVVKSLWLTFKKIPLAMRLFVLILICSVSFACASGVYAQNNAVISLKVQNQTVGDVLQRIEEQSEFGFFFNNKHVDLNRRVSVFAN